MDASAMQPAYTLDDAQQLHAQDPRHFLVPSTAEIDALQPGASLRLIFVLPQPQADGCRAERMWVTYTGRQNGVLIGLLENQPLHLTQMQPGTPVYFEPRHIATILAPPPSYDRSMLTIVTKTALENGQINWAMKEPFPLNAQDSGWNLFYGGEEPAYLDDPDNSSLLTLEDALAIEPLLEGVFGMQEGSFVYDAAQNRFVPAAEDNSSSPLSIQ